MTGELVRALVTGGRGFIGTHLVARLRHYGTDVHATTRPVRALTGRGEVAAAAPAQQGPVSWWPVDLADPDAVAALLAAVDPHVVFHLASDVRGARGLELVVGMLEANLSTAVTVMSAAAARERPPRVVLAGSIEEARTVGVGACSPYAAAKAATTTYAALFRELYALPVTVLRLAMVYGPAQPDTTKLVPHVITELLAGRRPQLGGGAREIDWVHVDDVVSAFLATADIDPRSDHVDTAVDIGTATRTSIRDTVALLVELIDPSLAPELTAWFDPTRDRRRQHNAIADLTAPGKQLGWTPRIGLRDGLAETVAWYRHHAKRLRLAPQPPSLVQQQRRQPPTSPPKPT